MPKTITIYLILSFIMTLFTAYLKSLADNTTLLNLSLQIFIFGIPSIVLFSSWEGCRGGQHLKTSLLILIIIPTIAFFTINENPLTIISLLLITPICEELFFRGIILNYLKTLSNHNPTKSILLSATIFAIFHISPIAMLVAFPAGILLGYLYHRYNYLGLCMVIHSVINYSLLFIYYLT